MEIETGWYNDDDTLVFKSLISIDNVKFEKISEEIIENDLQNRVFLEKYVFEVKQVNENLPGLFAIKEVIDKEFTKYEIYIITKKESKKVYEVVVWRGEDFFKNEFLI